MTYEVNPPSLYVLVLSDALKSYKLSTLSCLTGGIPKLHCFSCPIYTKRYH